MTTDYLLRFAYINTYFKHNESLLERGENAYHSGHVKKINFDAELFVIQGLVEASMKTKTYKVQVFLTDEYRVESAQCECPRGRVICHHISAIMFAAHYEISKTDVSCTWVKRKTNCDELKTCDEVLNLVKPPRVTERDLTDEEVKEMLDKLKKLPPVGMIWLLKDEPDPIDNSFNLIDVARVLQSDDFLTAVDQEQFLKQKLALTVEQIIEVANHTIGQRKNPDWYLARKLRITASNFGLVIGCIRRNRFTATLYKALIDQVNLDKVHSIQWGRIHEENAIKCLELHLGKTVRPTGIWLSKSGILGASPDGLIGEEYVAEAKCPYKYRDELLTEVLCTDDSYIVRFDKQTGRWMVNEDHYYFHQIQGQIHLMNAKGAWLVVWTPKQVVIKFVKKQDKWAINLVNMEKFFFKTFVPYLMTKQ